MQKRPLKESVSTRLMEHNLREYRMKSASASLADLYSEDIEQGVSNVIVWSKRANTLSIALTGLKKILNAEDKTAGR